MQNSKLIVDLSKITPKMSISPPIYQLNEVLLERRDYSDAVVLEKPVYSQLLESFALSSQHP